MKTLAEVEPRIAINATNTPGDADASPSVFKITQPGSYYLASNMTVPSGKIGIEIAANNVTIDFDGFTMTGEAGSLQGIKPANPIANIKIHNGTIENMGSDGINLAWGADTIAQHHTVENMAVREVGGMGMYLLDGHVRGSRVKGTGGTGIRLASALESIVSDTTVTDSGGAGISVRNGIVTSCTTSAATGSGIQVSNGIVQNSHVNTCATGINVSRGIITGNKVEDCETGVYVNGTTNIRGNTIVKSGSGTAGTGILVWSGERGSVIEDNHIFRQVTGIKVDATACFIAGNKIGGTVTAVNAAAGNRVGTIVSGTSSAAINGNSGGGLGTTDPFANILY